jgi:putative methyltransferase (TIGR04325 family)
MTFKIWQNSFLDFQTANKHKVGPGFSGSVYLERSLQAAEESLQSLKSGQQVPYFHKQRNVHLPIVASMLLNQGDRKIRILDFGGGLGIAYMALVESIPKLVNRVEYYIVENPAVCEIGESLFKSNLNISFSRKIPNNLKVDLIYSSSCIQYIEFWDETLIELCNLGARHILFSDFFSSNSKSFVSLQNYYESKIPHWFINLDDFLKITTSYGYELQFKSFSNLERLGERDLTKLSKNQINKQSLNLLFSKI